MTREFRDFIQEEKHKENLSYLEGTGGTKHRRIGYEAQIKVCEDEKVKDLFAVN